MSDVIKLLPESVANQIAAGEVVQRPASVVKELLENSIDAGATRIQLVLKDAGKTLIQVIDNGCGMSETDARMSFERHATSKIRESKDLFSILTMGFRGEALASIAAVAQVELRTRRAIDELGTRIVVEDSMVKIQEPCQCATGTSISVKNLFYNVPARRNFLKGDPVEMRHALEEFLRVSMAQPELHFSLHHNDQEIYHLPNGNLRQRIVKIFGDAINKKLVPVEEATDVLSISGFIGKPDYIKKSRGEQYFFVNKRFIKSQYLHHAVVNAYEDLLPADSHPMYVLFLEIDPKHIDINVHPTKQEIKFDDEKLVYHYLKVTVRHALGRNNITPTLDFETEPAFHPELLRQKNLRLQEQNNRDSVESFNKKYGIQNDLETAQRDANNKYNWQRMYENLRMGAQENINPNEPAATTASPGFEIRPSADDGTLDDEQQNFSKARKEPYQIHGQYLVSHIKSGFMLIDQQAASERILYERFLQALENTPIATQNALFPKSVTFSAADAALLRDILPEINCLGFDIQEFGGNTFVIHGAPADMTGAQEEILLEKVLNQYKENFELELGIRDNLARSMAKSASLKRGQILSVVEMQELID
ncbi:MAG: DNA mismatch repair endonuclease MutL, partial [Bacteroidetes bacterium]|nr:DNA mismatch repair endonuclease MutL [Bacteroidota bacterium]